MTSRATKLRIEEEIKKKTLPSKNPNISSIHPLKTDPTINHDNNEKNDNKNEKLIINTDPKKRKRLGRSARRRKAKQRAILCEFENLPQQNHSLKMNSSTLNPSSSVCPSDRSQTLPGVLERRKEHLSYLSNESNKSKLEASTDSKFSSDKVSNTDFFQVKDRIVLTRQLGFLPGNAICVAARKSNSIVSRYLCNFSNKDTNNMIENPIVLQLYPLAIRDSYAGGKIDGRKFKSRKRGNSGKDEKTRRDWQTPDKQGIIEPFPTIYWLTCPKLRTYISYLETSSAHTVKLFQQKLQSDLLSLQSMKEAHLAYGQTRWNLLTKDDKSEVERRGWKSSLGIERGVAGIRRHDTIKCLHTHAAHYLSGETKNVVGQWVMEAVQELVEKDQVVKLSSLT